MMYNEAVLTLLQQAVAKPLWPDEMPGVFTAEVGAKEIGSWLQLYLYIENNTVREVRYRVLGSGYLIAAVEWLNIFLTGVKLSTAEALKAKLIVEALVLPQRYHYCARMVVEALNNIVRQYG